MQVNGKEITVGCGVSVPVFGTHFRVDAEVVEIDEAQRRVHAKCDTLDGWWGLEDIRGVLNPGDFAVSNALAQDAQKEDS